MKIYTEVFVLCVDFDHDRIVDSLELQLIAAKVCFLPLDLWREPLLWTDIDKPNDNRTKNATNDLETAAISASKYSCSFFFFFFFPSGHCEHFF
jgi:hypothetical protein